MAVLFAIKVKKYHSNAMFIKTIFTNFAFATVLYLVKIPFMTTNNKQFEIYHLQD